MFLSLAAFRRATPNMRLLPVTQPRRESAARLARRNGIERRLRQPIMSPSEWGGIRQDGQDMTCHRGGRQKKAGDAGLALTTD